MITSNKIISLNTRTSRQLLYVIFFRVNITDVTHTILSERKNCMTRITFERLQLNYFSVNRN